MASPYYSNPCGGAVVQWCSGAVVQWCSVPVPAGKELMDPPRYFRPHLPGSSQHIVCPVVYGGWRVQGAGAGCGAAGLPGTCSRTCGLPFQPGAALPPCRPCRRCTGWPRGRGRGAGRRWLSTFPGQHRSSPSQLI